MSKAPTLTQVLAASGASRDSFNNWHRRNFLKQRIPVTTPGVARHMTRSAALEVAFIAALTNAGFHIDDAASRAQRCMSEERAGKLKPWLIYDPISADEWACGDKGAETRIRDMIFNPDKEDDKYVEGELIHLIEAEDLRRPPTQYAVINFAELVRRIDALFKGGKA